MRLVVVMTVLGLGLTAASCKKPPAPRDVPDGGRAATTEPVAEAPPPRFTHPRATGVRHLSDDDLFRFVVVSQHVTAALKSAGRPVEASPEGFLALDAGIPGDSVVDPVLSEAKMTPAEWSKLGARAWAAWSVAQVDYNDENRLRENVRLISIAQRRIKTAEASLQSGSRVLNDEERAIRIAALQDATINANDRAEMWANAATTLRERIDAIASQAQSLNASANADNVTPAQTTAINNSLSDLAAANTAMQQQLATAEQNERDARSIAARDDQAAQHPELPMSEADLAELRRESTALIERSTSEIARLETESDTLQTRLDDDHRAQATSRAKAGSEADIALMRDHLEEFNAAWGLGIDGRPLAPRRTTTSSQ